jgi:hypothetical protein
MRTALAVLALLFLSSSAKADPLNINDFPVFFINGNPVWIPIQATSSTVSSTFLPSLGTDVYLITYPFADGNGAVFMDLTDGEFGNIQFTAPVTSVTFDWTTESIFTAIFEGPGGSLGTFQSNQSIGSDTFSAADIVGIDWLTTSFGGIISIQDTPGTTTPAPEPATWLLLGLGLACVLTLSLRRSLPKQA